MVFFVLNCFFVIIAFTVMISIVFCCMYFLKLKRVTLYCIFTTRANHVPPHLHRLRPTATEESNANRSPHTVFFSSQFKGISPSLKLLFLIVFFLSFECVSVGVVIVCCFFLFAMCVVVFLFSFVFLLLLFCFVWQTITFNSNHCSTGRPDCFRCLGMGWLASAAGQS